MAQGRANGQTLIQAEGQTDWRALSTFPEFAAPTQAVPLAPAPGVDAARLVSGPATALMVVGILGAVAAFSALAVMLSGSKLQNLANMPSWWAQYIEQSSGGWALIRGFLGFAVSAFIIFASTKMRKLESHGLVMAATIISCVPCLSPCCCFPLPIVIWILIVLNKPDVKSAFR